MIISRKKYEKLNDDLIDAKAKVDDAKKSLHEENISMRATLLIKEQRDQYKAERDTLIDDIAVLKANISRLERENRDLKHENKALRIQSNTYFDEWQNEKLTSQGLREQCKEYAQDASKYITLTNHIRQKAEANPGVSRYIDLVNYIDRLERADDER